MHKSKLFLVPWAITIFLPLIFSIFLPTSTALAQDPDDVPEEILRTEIYTTARSPVDGKLLTAKEYIELREDLEEQIAKLPPESLVSQKVRDTIDALKLRKFIRQFLPFF